jgi:hypothetical protein
MKLKKEYIILLLVIAALCAYLATRSKDKTHFKLPEIGAVESQKINRLEISKGGNTIELNKKDDQWTIGPKAYLADSIKVNNMIKAAAEFQVTALVSESENYDRYDLTEDKKVRVRAYADKETLRDFDIGRQAPTRRHTFIKLTDDPKVYHARGGIDATFDQTVDELRDETVLAYQKDDITTVIISKDKQTLTISKKEVAVPKDETPSNEKEEPSKEKNEEQPKTEIQWSDSNGNETLKADIDLLIGDFSKLKCDDYLDDNAKDGLKNPLWSVTLKSANEEFTLSVFNKENEESIEEYPSTSSASPYAFVINKSRVETFQKHMDKLLKTEPEKNKQETPEKSKK